jgi:hypothetical protein
MTLSTQKLVAIANMLSDPRSAGNAASILAREAHGRGILVADLIAQARASTSASPPPPQSAPPTAPSWQDVESVNDREPYTKPIGPDHVGLVSEILAETPKAWCAQKPDGDEAWLAKSVTEKIMGKTRPDRRSWCCRGGWRARLGSRHEKAH